MMTIKDYLTEIRNFRIEVEELKSYLPKKFVTFCNLDETAVQLCMNSQGTYDIRGNNEVIVQGNSNSKKRLTFLLAILDNGVILPPLIIIQSRNLVPAALRAKFKNKAMIFSSPSGWMSDEILLKWFNNLYLTLKLPNASLQVLIFDHCPVHKKKNVIETIRQKGIKYFLIPPGCTGYLQPLDVVVNKPFKDRIRAHYKNWIESESLQTSKHHQMI